VLALFLSLYNAKIGVSLKKRMNMVLPVSLKSIYFPVASSNILLCVNFGKEEERKHTVQRILSKVTDLRHILSTYSFCKMKGCKEQKYSSHKY
jgi:hypothetical protein